MSPLVGGGGQARTLDEKQAEVLTRLSRVRDCKRQVLGMLEQMKREQPDSEVSARTRVDAIKQSRDD